MRLKVGDIDMDSRHGISIGNTPRAGSAHVQVATAVAKTPPLSPRLLKLMAALAGVVALVFFIAALLGGGWLAIPIPGLMLAALGCWIVARRRGVAAAAVPVAKAIPDEVLTARKLRIAALLSRETLPITVEQIAKKLKWADEAAVTGLAQLVREERVMEDLDLTTGEWTYLLQPKGVAISAEDRLRILPIAEREAALRVALDEQDETAEAEQEALRAEKAR